MFRQPEGPKTATAGADGHQHVCLVSPGSRPPGPLDPDPPGRARLGLEPEPARHRGVTPSDREHRRLSGIHLELHAAETG